ncbi:MAG: hypothetical protein JWR08_1715 [Enterovirga sp.]|nr:hypothetical protein [Enterovirga sp.]
MVLPQVALRLMAASVLIGGVALAGSAIAKPLSSEAKVASAEPAMTASAAPSIVSASIPETGPATRAADGQDGCTRKVKVVYAGYGEASRAGCVVSSRAN